MPPPPLAIGAFGSNVALLHDALVQLGFQLPDSEVRRRFFGPATRQAVLQVQQRHGLSVSGELDEATVSVTVATIARSQSGRGRNTEGRPVHGQDIEGRPVHGQDIEGAVRMQVRGVVRDVDGAVVDNASVAVVEPLLRGERQLGKAVTGADGRYEIGIVGRGTRGLGHLLVRADLGDMQLEEARQASSGADVIADFGPPGCGEFAERRAAIAAWLDGLDVDALLENAQQKDLTFLSERMGLGVADVAAVLMAQRLAANYQTSAESFYALLRQGEPRAVTPPAAAAFESAETVSAAAWSLGTAIIALAAQRQRELLLRAVDEAFVRASLRNEIDAIVARWQQRAREDVLDLPFAETGVPLRELLTLAAIPADRHDRIAAGWREATMPAAFWDAPTGGDTGPTEEQRQALRRVLDCGHLVSFHRPSLQRLLDQHAAGVFAEVSELALRTRADWEQLLRQLPERAMSSLPVTGDAADLRWDQRVTVFAKQIITRAAVAYPTPALIATATDAGIDEATVPHLKRYFLNTHIDLLSDRGSARRHR